MLKLSLLFVIFSVLYYSGAADPTWTVLDSFKYTSVGGVFATSEDTCYVAYSDNDSGPGEWLTKDAGATFTTTTGGSLNTDIAKDSQGNGIITSIGAIYTSTNGVIEKLEGRDITFSQNVETFGDGKFAVAGQHYPDGITGPFKNGPAITTDAGKSWTYYDTGLDGNKYAARYGAYPSDTTWYVSQGSWVSVAGSNYELNYGNATVENLPLLKKSWGVNAHVRVHHLGHNDFKVNIRDKKVKSNSILYGAISKTTDGGQTFHQVYDTKGQHYMNAISCSSTEICMAVAESTENAIVIRTEDGGKTWNTVMESPESDTDVSLMGCKMLSDDEVWISGGTFDKGTLGWFFHSTDAGKTWKQYDVPKGYSIDLSFSGDKGYSPAMTETGSSVSVFA